MSLTLETMAGRTGLALVAVNVFADQLGLPVPAAPTLLIAGALAAEHLGWGGELWVLATIACVLPDLAWYWAGQIYGNRIMHLLCRISLTPDSCVSDTHQQFERWGGKALVVAKFIPGLAVIAPPLAGAMHMSWIRFVLLSTAGALLWVGAYLVGGALFAEQINWMLPKVVQYGAQAIMAAAILLLAYILYKWWERRRFYSALRMPRISVAELYDLMARKPAPVVIDVRSRSARELEPRMIPTAIPLPPDEVAAQSANLPRDREIVSYCTCPNEATAAQVANMLKSRGFARVRPLQGGLDAWIEAGYPVAGAALGEAPTATALS